MTKPDNCDCFACNLRRSLQKATQEFKPTNETRDDVREAEAIALLKKEWENKNTPITNEFIEKMRALGYELVEIPEIDEEELLNPISFGEVSNNPNTAPQFMEKALQHMLDRAATYDQPDGERSMSKTVEAFNAITGRDLDESEGWLLMQLLKSVRLFTSTTFHQDSAEDNIAYGALMAESRKKDTQ